MSVPDSAPAPAGRMARVWTYLQYMFPPAVMVPASFASFLAVHFGLQAFGEPSIVEGPLAMTTTMVLGALSLFLFSLLLRVYDELKDVESDLRLGQAGDPRYAGRPIVTGAVSVGDIEALRNGVVLALVVLNLWIGTLPSFLAFGAVFALCWLSSRWFFWPAVSKNLLLAFVTHNPLSLAIGFYVVAIYRNEFVGDLPIAWGSTLGLLVGLWAPVAAWEVGRKIRLPADETDYETYSKVLGWRAAAAIVGVLPILSAVLLGVGLCGLGQPTWVWLLPSAFAILPIAAVARLLLVSSSESANLKPWLEGYILLVNVGLTVLWTASYGLKMGV